MKLQLASSVASPQDLTALQLEIREYARWYAHTAIKKRRSVKQTSQPAAASPEAVQLLRTWTAEKPLTVRSLDELIEGLAYLEATAAVVTITLAAPPSNNLKQTLVEWCREHIASNVLVRFQFNGTLLGGMVLRYGSRVFDWSFRRQILANRQQFPEALRRVR